MELGKDFDPRYKADFVKRKKDGEELLKTGVEMLAEYQAKLAAQDFYGVLVVLQALDAAGKDGTIRHVMSGINPQGVSVHSFKVPSSEELDHDFLWRYGERLPAAARGIFNRSHYEEVLVVRVHPELLDRQQLPRRPGDRVLEPAVRRHQRLGAVPHRNGIKIVKLFLNLSKEEQRTRFLGRIDSPRRTGSSLRTTPGSGTTGTTTSGRSRNAVHHQYRVGAVVRASRPTGNGLPGLLPVR